MFFLITAILISVDILERAVDSGESMHLNEVLDLSVTLLKKSRQGELLSPESLDTYESSIVTAMSNSKERFLFRDELLKRLIILLIINALPYLILAYIAIFFVVSRAVKPITTLTNIVKLYPDIKPEMLTINPGTDREVAALTKQFKIMLHNISEYQKKLEARSKLDGWIEVSRAIIHEVGNAMAPAKDLIGQLILEVPNNQKVGVIKKSIVQMDTIFQHMRQFYKSETIIRTKFNVIEEIQFICEGYGVTFNNETDSNAIIISGAKTECIQIIINLIKNALDAVSETNTPHVQVSVLHVQEQLAIQISDNGRGIDSDHIKRIFTPGYSNKQDGFVIGLAIVSKYITLHEWNICVSSQLNKGTQFTISIPKRDIYETVSTAA